MTENKVELFGINFDALPLEDAVEAIVAKVESGRFCYAVTPNVDHIIKLQRDRSLVNAYGDAEFVFADGVPLLWAAVLLKRALRYRVNGTDLFERLCKVAAEREYRVFFLGGSEGTAEEAARRLQLRYPRLEVAGWLCPPFGFDLDPIACRAVQDEVARSGADILFVGLGAPKQETWIHRYGEGTGVCFAVGIGVSFSFVSGEFARAPRWMQRYGMEWVWRLSREPSRLWRRYLVDDLAFVPLTIREWMKQLQDMRER